MGDPTEVTFDLDRKHRALVSGARWAVQKLLQTGAWDMISTGQGGGRTILRWCEANDVHPNREAELILGALPDIGFRDRG
jgi:hypothetical protein